MTSAESAETWYRQVPGVVKRHVCLNFSSNDWIQHVLDMAFSRLMQRYYIISICSLRAVMILWHWLVSIHLKLPCNRSVTIAPKLSNRVLSSCSCDLKNLSAVDALILFWTMFRLTHLNNSPLDAILERDGSLLKTQVLGSTIPHVCLDKTGTTTKLSKYNPYYTASHTKETNKSWMTLPRIN